MLPGIALGAATSAELKRTDNLDMRRAGKVSEDERAVLRIEWRAGMSGVDQDRSLQEMLVKLRQMENSANAVGQVFRNLPADNRTTKPKPVVAAVPPSEPPADTEPNWRLMAANLMALVLVGAWWSNRRKGQREAAALEAKLAAKASEEAAIKSAGPMPKFADFPPPPIEAIDVEARVQSSDRIEPMVTSAPVVLEAMPVIAPGPVAEPEVDPAPFSDSGAEPLPPLNETPAAAPEPAAEIDFVLEEIDAASVVPEPPRPRSLVKPTTADDEPGKKSLEPTLQLAEIMLSMGLEQGAAQTLVDYTEANPRDAIYHMLKLLGIYRKRGLHQEFQETAEKLRKNFNIQAEDWAAGGSGEAPTLEKFSRVSQHVQSIWNQPEECISYLRHLIEDNRDGARAGFPQSVAEEILLLVEILKETSGLYQAAG